MSILVDKNTRLLVQGITGSSGAFHANGCMEYGTNVVAGVTPGKGGLMFEGKVPVFDTVYEARQQTGCNATMIFVPARICCGRNPGSRGCRRGIDRLHHRRHSCHGYDAGENGP